MVKADSVDMTIIAAVDNNWGIGKNNKLLVSIPDDMKRFREQTTGGVVVMGRHTLESLPGGRPLKDRINVVLSRNISYKVDGAIVAHSVDEVKAILEKNPNKKAFCIGGESIYKLLLPLCDEALLTKIDYAYDADTYFPNLDKDEGWEAVWESDEETYYDLIYSYVRYKRV